MVVCHGRLSAILLVFHIFHMMQIGNLWPEQRTPKWSILFLLFHFDCDFHSIVIFIYTNYCQFTQ